MNCMVDLMGLWFTKLFAEISAECVGTQSNVLRVLSVSSEFHETTVKTSIPFAFHVGSVSDLHCNSKGS